MSPRFQQWASAFPLSRPIARRRAQSLFDLCGGFVYSQVLLACVRLRLLQRLAEQPRTARALGGLLSLPEDRMLRLLQAAAALGLAERVADEEFGLGAQGATLLGNPGLLPMIEHHAMFYADLQDPIALLRGEVGSTRLGQFWAYARNGDPKSLTDEQTRDYTALMSSTQSLVAASVSEAYRFGRHRHVLDAGGGSGTFAAHVARCEPALQVTVFDLPAVASRARMHFAELGLQSRLRAVEGDFLRDELPRGADLITLVRVLHDHDSGCVQRLLRACADALPPRGTLLIAEPMSGTNGGEVIADAYFGLYLLAMGSGRARTFEELAALVRNAGFERPRLLSTRMPALVRVLVAEKVTPRSVIQC